MDSAQASEQRELRELVAIAREAGERIAQVYAGTFTASYKQGAEPVTEADRRSHELLVSRLRTAFPGEAIVSEEADAESYRGFAASPRIFFVDPLDGTREFVQRNAEFSVLIGVVEGLRARLGVVHAPALACTWWGGPATGAWRSDAGAPAHRIGVTRAEQPSEARLVVSRSHPSPALPAALQLLGCREVTPVGSAGLKGAYVADGHADAFLALRTAGKAWDVCAADALVHAAGGSFTDALGRAMDYRGDLLASHGILAAPFRLHAALLERLRGVDR